MAGHLSADDFWGLVQHILPFYIILIIAYGFARRNIIQKVHALGLSRWTSLVGIPIYVGNMLAFNDPYAINLRLVGADALQKGVVLVVAGLWWLFSRQGNIDGVITFFMLATLSNMVLVGPALFEPLHGSSSKVSIATIIILQCALWYNLCIVLFETRAVLKEMNSKTSTQKTLEWSEPGKQDLSSALGVDFESLKNIKGERNSLNLSPTRLQRTTSAPARVSFSTARVGQFPMILLKTAQVAELLEEGVSPVTSQGNKITAYMGCETMQYPEAPARPDASAVTIDVSGDVKSDIPGSQSSETPRIKRMTHIKIVSFKVLNRMKYAPLTYTSVVGFVYSLLAFRYDWEMPYPIITSVQLVAHGAIAISVVTMALTWAESGRLISCGIKKMIYGFIIRFLVGPLIMAFCALAFGLTGIAFEFSVLQAALPVGLVSFVLAKEYGLDVDVFSTAVITQLVIFLPLVVVYYFILQPIGV